MTAEAISQALVSVAEGDIDAAVDRLGAIEGSRLAAGLIQGLADDRADGVYVDPAAFTRFIDSGPNDRLYGAVDAALGRWVASAANVDSVVDIGCGDGRVTSAVVPDDVMRIELVEPSDALLQQATARLASRPVTAFGKDVAGWLATGAEPRVDMGWATFALHNLPPEDRRSALRGIATRVGRFAVVEFDVPEWESVEQWAAHCAERYVEGADAHDDSLVLAGFLVPVLLGQFAPGAERHTYEQPLAGWRADFEEAGFAETTVEIVHSDFWWGNAGLVTGHSSA